MTTRKTLDRVRAATHIIVRADSTGTCEFLNDASGGWTKHSYLAIRVTEIEAGKIAQRVGGMAIPDPKLAPVEPKTVVYLDPEEA